MKNSIAWQLLSIARMEAHLPFHGAKVLIVGQGQTAEELKQLLLDEGALVECDDTLEQINSSFELVFLLDEAKNDDLLPLLEKNALVIDYTPKNGDNWSVFDAKGSFRRIKVVSLLKDL